MAGVFRLAKATEDSGRGVHACLHRKNLWVVMAVTDVLSAARFYFHVYFNLKHTISSRYFSTNKEG